jgi:hypothetical protein
MKKTIFLSLLLATAITLTACGQKTVAPTVTEEPTNNETTTNIAIKKDISDMIKNISPKIDEEIACPTEGKDIICSIKISGEARGTWFFEASAPVKILDATDKELATGYVTAKGDWMTEDFIPFVGEIIFKKPNDSKVVLVLQNDNPSGNIENQLEIKIPLTLADKTGASIILPENFTETGEIINWDGRSESYTNNWHLNYSKPGYNVIAVDLQFNSDSLCNFGFGYESCLERMPQNENNGQRFKVEGYKNENKVTVKKLTIESQTKTKIQLFFNNEKDLDLMDCRIVRSVTREIPKTTAVARAALTELLSGPTAAEKKDGYSSEVPSNTKIQRLEVKDGVAKVDFSKELEAGGGSCHMEAIRSQITETLKQFPTVKSVIISIDGRTENILQP